MNLQNEIVTGKKSLRNTLCISAGFLKRSGPVSAGQKSLSIVQIRLLLFPKMRPETAFSAESERIFFFPFVLLFFSVCFMAGSFSIRAHLPILLVFLHSLSC